MKKLVVILAVVMALVFAEGALAVDEEPKNTSPKVEDKTDLADNSKNNNNGGTKQQVEADPDAVLDEDVSKYKDNPEAVDKDYNLDGEFTTPVIFESEKTKGTSFEKGQGTITKTVMQSSLEDGDKVAVYITYKQNGKIVRKRLESRWENGKLKYDIPEDIAEAIANKEYRIDLIGEKK